MTDAPIEIDASLVAKLATHGLAEFKNGSWQLTDKGSEWLREYLSKGARVS